MSKVSVLRSSLRNMTYRKTRSVLTIVSVFIGIIAIFVLISFGQGLVAYINEISQQMGDDKLIIQPKGGFFGAPPIDSHVRMRQRDVNFVEQIDGIEEAVGVYYTTTPVEVNDKQKYVYVQGVNLKDGKELINELYNLKIEAGKELEGNEKRDGVFGFAYTKKDNAFSQQLLVGDKVEVNGIKIEVQGFYETLGNPIDDYNVYLTEEAYEEIFSPTDYQAIFVRSSSGVDPVRLTYTVKEKLRKDRGQVRGNEDFFVQTFDQVIESFSSILTTLNVVLILIAFISLVVAGVNIANTMYTSVLERTKDIGIMKSIGAKNSDIWVMFTFESGFLSLIGGIAGMVVGMGIAVYAGRFLSSSGYGAFQPAFPPSLFIGCLLFSLFIGVFSGLMPAYRAAKTNPVDALRYE
jgi:putative ABC transport system permease protein